MKLSVMCIDELTAASVCVIVKLLDIVGSILLYTYKAIGDSDGDNAQPNIIFGSLASACVICCVNSLIY